MRPEFWSAIGVALSVLGGIAVAKLNSRAQARTAEAEKEVSAGHLALQVARESKAESAAAKLEATSMDFIGNRASGATDYGYRGLATNARTFRGNSFAGTLGSMLTAPSNYVAIADTSGATLAALETTVNALKAVMRNNGLFP